MSRRALRTLPVVGALAAALTTPTVATAAPTAVAPTAGSVVVMVSNTGQKITAAQVAAATNDKAALSRLADAAAGPDVAQLKLAPKRSFTPKINGLDQIIDGDSRQPAANNYFPNSAIAYVESTESGGCTGFLVSRDTVLTAAHCLYDYYHGGHWANDFWVTPGRNGYAQPFGSCSAGQMWVPNDWIATGQQRYDFGAIKLGCDFGPEPGWFRLFSNTNTSLVNKFGWVTGYPTDKYDPAPRMWEDYNKVLWNDSYSMGYKMDTMYGNSGGPVFFNRLTSSGNCAGICAAGIHTNDGTPGNIGVRFNAMNMGHINYWIGLPRLW